MSQAIPNTKCQHLPEWNQSLRTAAKCDDKSGSPSGVTAVALLVASAVIGGILFGPPGLVILPAFTLLGLWIVILITDDHCRGSVKVHTTYHSTPKYGRSSAPGLFSALFDLVSLPSFQTSYRSSGAPAARGGATGPHLPRGHFSGFLGPEHEGLHLSRRT